MNRNDLRIIVGGARDAALEDGWKFVSAYSTDSRLMGAFVVYIQWERAANHSPADESDAGGLHQFFYVETTEIGIESYKSVRGESAVHLMQTEQSMMGGLGAHKVELTEREARVLVREYAEYNRKFGEALPEGETEYAFLLSGPFDEPDDEERNELLAKICVSPQNDYELINYFLMRHFAADDIAAGYLTAPGADADIRAPWPSSDALCLNKSRVHRSEDGGQSYICESLIERGSSHRIIVSEIAVSGNKVSAFGIINDFAISGVETAMKLERPEFITVYEIFTDPEKAMEHLDSRYLAAMQRDTDAGRLYLRFNENNDHMQRPVFRMNDDVKGMIYVTDEAQLVLAAYSLPLIHRLEREAQGWPFCRQLLPVAKYEFKEDIFYDFVRADTGDFVRYVNEVCDFDPEDR